MQQGLPVESSVLGPLIGQRWAEVHHALHGMHSCQHGLLGERCHLEGLLAWVGCGNLYVLVCLCVCVYVCLQAAPYCNVGRQYLQSTANADLSFEGGFEAQGPRLDIFAF